MKITTSFVLAAGLGIVLAGLVLATRADATCSGQHMAVVENSTPAATPAPTADLATPAAGGERLAGKPQTEGTRSEPSEGRQPERPGGTAGDSIAAVAPARPVR